MTNRIIEICGKPCKVGKLLAKGKGGHTYLAKMVADNQIKSDHITQIFNMCKLLYPNNLNIDYFPTNFVEQQGRLHYVDYECSHYSDEWNFENWGIWFLANETGFASFLKNGNHTILLENGKPKRKGYEECVEKWLQLKS